MSQGGRDPDSPALAMILFLVLIHFLSLSLFFDSIPSKWLTQIQEDLLGQWRFIPRQENKSTLSQGGLYNYPPPIQCALLWHICIGGLGCSSPALF